MTVTGGNGRVILLSFAYKPAQRVIDYILFLQEHGVAVDFITRNADQWHAAGLPDDVRIVPVESAEMRSLSQRLKRMFVYRLPGGSLAILRWMMASNPVTRPTVRGVERLQRLHRRIGRAFDGWIFNPYYRVVRPRVLARATDKALRNVHFSDVSRIVAVEVYAITSAWHLAKRFPQAAAATNMDRTPYLPAQG